MGKEENLAALGKFAEAQVPAKPSNVCKREDAERKNPNFVHVAFLPCPDFSEKQTLHVRGALAGSQQ
jgi:hypothetical protein